MKKYESKGLTSGDLADCWLAEYFRIEMMRNIILKQPPSQDTSAVSLPGLLLGKLLSTQLSARLGSLGLSDECTTTGFYKQNLLGQARIELIGLVPGPLCSSQLIIQSK